jgi:hypothetical protein
MIEILILTLTSLFPKYLDAEAARLHASSAYSAEQETGVPATLLLGIAYHESRFDPFSLSRMECRAGTCTRVTGIWRQEKPPAGARQTFYCGVLQVGGWVSWKECRRLMFNIPDNYKTAAKELTGWLNDPSCIRLRGDDKLICALMGYGGGYRAINSNSARYARRVKRMADHIRAFMLARRNT